MRRRDIVLLILAVAFFTVMVIRADDAKPAVRSVAVPPESIASYAEAQKRVDEAVKIVEASPAWKDLLIIQQQRQTALYAALAEAGLKPSDGCKPVFNKENKLESFECPIVKPKEPEKKP